jgi:hypothetical protein
VGKRPETVRELLHQVTVAGPTGKVAGQMMEKIGIVVYKQLGAPEFPVFTDPNLAAEHLGDDLHAIAYPEYGNAELEYAFIRIMSFASGYRRRASGKDQPFRGHVGYLRGRRIIWYYAGENLVFPDPARD